MNKSNIFKAVSKIITDTFLQATAWMFLGTGVLSFGNYLYHLVMGRMLGPSEYGVLESLISFSYILSVPLMTLNLIIVKYVASYKGHNDYDSISSFYIFLTKKFMREGVLLCLLLILLSPLITSFLHLSSFTYAILLVAFVFTGLFSGLGKGMLQGLSNFAGLTAVNTVESISKIVLAVLLVYFGFKSQGGLIGIVIAATLAFFAARFFLGSIKKKNPKQFQEGHLIGKYTVPTFFTTLGMTSLFTTDVLLARHFLAPEVAGYYAALSILGKIVFFAVSPITLVMFPFVSERNSRGEKYGKIIALSMALTLLGAGIVILVYYLFPQLVVLTLFGKHFLPISGFVWMFGIFIGIYSICYLIANFFLSIHKTIPTYFVITASLLQIIAICFFHNSIDEMIFVSILTTFLLLITLLLYYASAIHGK